MKIPVWVKPGVWGGVIGAIAISLIGFTQLGWMGSTSAERMAAGRADTAVIAALVPFCLDKAARDPDTAVMTRFKAEQSSYSRNDIVTKAGWATLDGGKIPNDGLARACSDKLHAAKVG